MEKSSGASSSSSPLSTSVILPFSFLRHGANAARSTRGSAEQCQEQAGCRLAAHRGTAPPAQTEGSWKDSCPGAAAVKTHKTLVLKQWVICALELKLKKQIGERAE